MKYLFTLILFTLFGPSYAQTNLIDLPYEFFETAKHNKKKKISGETYYIFNTDTLKGLKKYVGDSLVLDGYAYEITNEIYYKVPYINGEQTGEVLGYYHSGELALKARVKKAQVEGLFLMYYKNGIEQARFTYEGENIIGESIYRNEDGSLNKKIQNFPNENREEVAVYAVNASGNDYIRHQYTTVSDLVEGKEIFYYPNGKVETENNLVNGNYHGTNRSFYENGQLHTIDHFVNGSNEGEYLVYFEDGQIETIENFKDNKREGVYKFYSIADNGEHFLSDSCVYVNNKIEGERKEYYYSVDSARAYLYKVSHYKKGDLNGTETSFREDGDVMSIYEYSNGQKHGAFQSFYYNSDFGSYLGEEGFYSFNALEGEVKAYSCYKRENDEKVYYMNSLQHFKNGLRHGQALDFNEKGDTTSIYSYVDGNIEGKRENYYFTQSGKRYLNEEQEFKNGHLHGISTIFDTLGRVTEESTWAFGEMNGVRKKYVDHSDFWGARVDANYKLYMTEEFLNGQKHGKSKEFDSLGRVILVEDYQHNQRNGLAVKYGNDSWAWSDEEADSFYKLSVYSYKNDQLEGHYEEYNKDGAIEEEGEYLAGQRVGVRNNYQFTYDENKPYVYNKEFYEFDTKMSDEYYNEDGKISSKTLYANGLVKQEISFSDKGDTLAIVNYVNGNKEGLVTEYYSSWSGDQVYKGYTYTYHNDRLEGDRTEFLESGAVYRVTPYKSGQIHGTEILYFSDSKIIEEKNEYYRDIWVSQEVFASYSSYSISNKAELDKILKENNISKRLFEHYNPGIDMNNLPSEVNIPNDLPKVEIFREVNTQKIN